MTDAEIVALVRAEAKASRKLKSWFVMVDEGMLAKDHATFRRLDSELRAAIQARATAAEELLFRYEPAMEVA